jgi:flagellar motor switch protein FliN/FliY
MNGTGAKPFAEGFLKGFLDVLAALLSSSIPAPQVEVGPSTQEGLESALASHPVCLRARVKGGGLVAVLLGVEGAARLAAVVAGRELPPTPEADDEVLKTLKELAESALGGGASHFKEKYGKEIPLEDVDASRAQAETTAELATLLGADGSLATFGFALAPGTACEGVLLFSHNLESVIPQVQTQVEEMTHEASAPQPDQKELKEILQEFNVEGQAPSAGPLRKPAGSVQPSPTNLDMILDIQLVATARLGRVEMPIGEIMALGPGSIIEVGHLVDEPVELLVNGKLIARGDVVVVDEKFGLRITEIVSPQERITSLR